MEAWKLEAETCKVTIDGRDTCRAAVDRASEGGQCYAKRSTSLSGKGSKPQASKASGLFPEQLGVLLFLQVVDQPDVLVGDLLNIVERTALLVF